MRSPPPHCRTIALLLKLGYRKSSTYVSRVLWCPLLDNTFREDHVLFCGHSGKLWRCPRGNEWGTLANKSLGAASADTRWLQVMIRFRARPSQLQQCPRLTLKTCRRNDSREKQSSGKAVRQEQMSNVTCLHLSDKIIDVRRS